MRRGATASSRLYPVVGCTREQSCCSWDSNPPRPFLHLRPHDAQALLLLPLLLPLLALACDSGLLPHGGSRRGAGGFIPTFCTLI
ncbi:hypothetical protein Tco_0222936 [Tanacetum coccineum]